MASLGLESNIFRRWNAFEEYIDKYPLGYLSLGQKIEFLINNLYSLLNRLVNPIPGDTTNWYLLKNNVIEADTSYNRDLYKTFDFINNLIDTIMAQINFGIIRRINFSLIEKENIYLATKKLRNLVREFLDSDFILNPEVKVLPFIRFLNGFIDRLDMADPIETYKKYYQKYLKYKSKYLELKQKLNK